MKTRLTIALAAAALAATVTSLMAAGLYQRSRAQVTAADTLPAYEILNSVRALGFKPTTQALRRGPYYMMHAIDPRGIEVRLVADAQLGDIVSVAPVLAPRFNGGPRIIHVPQPGERSDANSTYESDENSVTDDNDDTDVPPPPRRPARQPSRRMEAPPARASTDPVPPPRARPEPKPLGPPRNVLSAPPPPAGGLTPIYPTPKFEPRNEPAEKFVPPEERSDPVPPPGYMPAPPSRG